MFAQELKHVANQAMASAFGPNHPDEDFRGLHVSIEFPGERQHYPGIWVDFDPVGTVQTVGIGHIETNIDDQGEETKIIRHKRWAYAGTITYTVVALTSWQRDRLHDAVLRILAFGKEHPQLDNFHELIADNEFIGIVLGTDQITTSGWSAVPGTPWGSDEVIYEATLRVDCTGEFVSDGLTATLVPLREVEFLPYVEGEDPPDPVPSGGWL